MRITTKIVFDSNGQVLEHAWYDYAGPVALAKGDDVARQQEAQQLQFNTQLMSIFQQQFSKQQQLLGYLQGKLKPMIDNPTGYSDQALTALRTGATDQLSAAYQNAQQALQNKEFTQGGRDLPSGVNAQLDEALMQAQAGQKAQAQNDITVQNENQKQSNYWNALNILNGQSANQESPLGYAGAYNSGSGNVAGLSQAVTASNQSQLLGALGGIAAGAGSALAGPLGKSLGCWVAASLFGGWQNQRTKLVRLWMWCKAPAWFRLLYIKYGQQLSRTPFRWSLFPVFKYVLVRYA